MKNRRMGWLILCLQLKFPAGLFLLDCTLVDEYGFYHIMELMEKKFAVEFYEKESGEKPCLDFLNTLEVKLRAKAFRDLALLEAKGTELRMPYSEHLDDGIFELRTKQGSNILRSLYFFFVGKKIVVTHGFRKKTQKTPPEEISRAKEYRKDYIAKHQNEEKTK